MIYLILGIMIAIFVVVLIWLFVYSRRTVQFLKSIQSKSIKMTVIMLHLAVIWIAVFYQIKILLLLHVLAFAALCDLAMFFYKKKDKQSQRVLNVYKSGIVPLVCATSLIIYGSFVMRDIKITSYDIETDKVLSQDYKVALIADLHFPTTMDSEELKDNIKLLNQQKPDVVILAGDIVDDLTTKEEMITAFEVLGTIDSQYGIYFTYGNHDQGVYRGSPHYSAKEMETVFQQNNITVLCDTIETINDDIILIGRDDFSNPRHEKKRMPLEELTKEVNMSHFTLLIDHQPKDTKKVEELGIDLEVSGHTHNGQFFPLAYANLIVPVNEVEYGHVTKGQSHYIVSSGMGGWAYPVQTYGKSEIVIINLKK